MKPGTAASLSARAHDALDELTSLHATDPAAAPAMRAVRLIEHTLSEFWLPALARRVERDGR